MRVHQLSVKLFAEDPASVDVGAFNAIFQSWIQENRIPGRLLIDVADYLHVPDGPGIVLVGNEAHYALDAERGALGLLYSRKRDQPGELSDKLVEAFRDLVRAARLLEEAPSPPIRFRTDEVRIAVMSRRFAPNHPDTYAAARPVLDAFAARLYPGHAVSLEHLADPREPFTVLLRGGTGSPFPDI